MVPHKSDRHPSKKPRTRAPHTPKTRPNTQPLYRRAAGHGGPVHADLIVIAHPVSKALGTRFRLVAGQPMTIGRATDADISLSDVASVSRHHARLHYQDDGSVVLEDLGSTNGTWIDEGRIRGVHPLSNGDRFQVGSVHFKLLHERDVEAAYHKAIYDLLTRDGLTDAWNKGAFEEELGRERLRAQRYERPLSLILFDLDHFKEVNDSYGHLCGDMVLKKTAAIATGILRSEQVLGRVGGEEFGVLCPETALAGAVTVAERLREAIIGHEHRYGKHVLRVSCSFGVAQSGAEAGWVEFFAAADSALYASKAGGRNRVTAAPAS
jgi:diguanylate cyclase (GGDEF)-like protein